MGVKKIILVDYDTVESHNLNRQLLFSKQHVGKSKVECAKEVLQDLHDLNHTLIETYHFDAKKEWRQVVELSRECSVVFNLIDQGDEWDIAVQSLALVRMVPMLSGGTFQTTVTADFCRPYVKEGVRGHQGHAHSEQHRQNPTREHPQSEGTISEHTSPEHHTSRLSNTISATTTLPKPTGGPCFLCMGTSNHMDLVREKLTTEHICELRDLNFLPVSKMPIGASNVYVASTCSNMMLASWAQWLMTPEDDSTIPNRTFMYMNDFDLEKWSMNRVKDCVLCGHLYRKEGMSGDIEDCSEEEVIKKVEIKEGMNEGEPVTTEHSPLSGSSTSQSGSAAANADHTNAQIQSLQRQVKELEQRVKELQFEKMEECVEAT